MMKKAGKMYPEKNSKGVHIMSKRQLLILIVIIALILGAMIVIQSNQQGEAITQGLQDIINR